MDRKQEILHLIQTHIQSTGFVPTQAWIAKELGLSQPTVHAHVESLRMIGALEKIPHSQAGLCLNGVVGLTQKQKTLLETLKTQGGNGHIQTIAKNNGVRASSIYYMLNILMTKGLVTVDAGVAYLSEKALTLLAIPVQAVQATF
jgi:DNA-binding IclR family transcriptional regulator